LGVPPPDDTTKICGVPSRSETNASSLPSGDHDGEVSIALLSVIRLITFPSLALIT
jgi:hypothetical protein